MTAPKPFTMLTMLITGASRGIGLEMTRQFAADGGWRVHACCRAPGKAGDLKGLAAESGGLITVHDLDVTDTPAIGRLAAELKGQPIDLLVNNAGIYDSRQPALQDVDETSWMDVLRTNTIAPLKMAAAFLPHVAASRRKIIASISSGLGSIQDNTSGGYYSYRTSKAALNMVMKGLSVELAGRGIVCVALSPGWVRTDMGGASAPLSPRQSVTGLRKVIEGLTPADSGAFIGHDGSRLAW